jgi:DNA repair exonuclease SbcCD ATPase subunit
MTRTYKLILVLASAVSLPATIANAQDSPTLGDLARQQRSQKASAGATDVNSPKIITNEGIPENATPQPAANPSSSQHGTLPQSSNGMKQSAEHWKSQIEAQKNQIASLQKQMDQLNQSVRFVSHPCEGPRCVEWNQRQREKQQRIERMQAELDTRKKNLGEMQESARKQGYGNSVYEPDTTK